jgi:hypothetical protein
LFNSNEQFLKRWLQVGLIVNQQHVLTEKTGVKRLAFETETIAAEEYTTADHVHRAHDDCWASWISGPFPIIGELPS